MATADEILATMAEEAAETEQAAEVCTIDRCTRAVTIPEALRIVGVETDKDVTRRQFRVLCSYRGTDLSPFRIRIHFQNANKEKDVYYVADAAQDGEYLTFSWVISRKATKYKGKLQFIACMVCNDGTDEEREWNSTLGEFTVLEGLEVELTEGEEEQARDAIAQLLDVIDARESEAVEAVSVQGATQIAAVQAAGAKQEAIIAAKGAKTLATIPDDYAALHNKVQQNAAALNDKAPVIIDTLAGPICTTDVAASMPLAGLTLCGKTTQSGTPTPSAPVPLANVGAGGSISVTIENGGSLTASTPNGLAGIPVSSGGNYMDANGVHWYCDYRDYENGLSVQRVHVLDAASVSWNPNGTNRAGDGYIFYAVLYGTLSQRDMMSNRFRQNQIHPGGSWDVLNIGEATVIVDDGADLAYVILCMPVNINTADAINAYFAANPTTFLCAQKTPVITSIPADEMAAFREMKTSKPNATVYNDTSAFMYVSYVADAKLYIDKRLAAIAGAMLNM